MIVSLFLLFVKLMEQIVHNIAIFANTFIALLYARITDPAEGDSEKKVDDSRWA